MKKISICSSCYNEELNLAELYKRVSFQMDKFKDGYEFEYIIEDNCSTDNSENILRELAKNDKRIKIILNSRNFGHIKSPYNAIISSFGDAVIYIASDLQDPPELISDLIEKWESGAKVVLLQKNTSMENSVIYSLRKLYYNILSKISDTGVELAKNCTGAGLFDKKVVDIIRSIDDPYPYLRGLLCEIGFKREYIQFNQPKRKNGKTTNNFYSLYDNAMIAVTKYSKVPLRFMTFFGFLTSILMAFLAVFYLFWKLIYWDTFEFGVAPIIISILFLGSVQLFCLGILGEYIGAIYTRVDKKPIVVEKERINF